MRHRWVAGVLSAAMLLTGSSMQDAVPSGSRVPVAEARAALAETMKHDEWPAGLAAVRDENDRVTTFAAGVSGRI